MFSDPRRRARRRLRIGAPLLLSALWAVGFGSAADSCQLCTLGNPAVAATPADDGPDPHVAPAFGTPRSGWPQSAPGAPVYLTYSYNNLLDGGLKDAAGISVPPGQIRTAVEEALAVWAEVAPLHFAEVEDQGGPVYTGNYANGQFGQIRFSHRYINGPDPHTGDPTTKALAYFPSTTSNIGGDVHFDNSDPWELVGTTREPDVLGAAIHEIGHALGLTHSVVEDANMYWVFKRHTGPGSGMLHADDIAAIQSLYGAGTGSVAPLHMHVPEPDALFIALLAAGACAGARGTGSWKTRRRNQSEAHFEQVLAENHPAAIC